MADEDPAIQADIQAECGECYGAFEQCLSDLNAQLATTTDHPPAQPVHPSLSPMSAEDKSSLCGRTSRPSIRIAPRDTKNNLSLHHLNFQPWQNNCVINEDSAAPNLYIRWQSVLSCVNVNVKKKNRSNKAENENNTRAVEDAAEDEIAARKVKLNMEMDSVDGVSRAGKIVAGASSKKEKPSLASLMKTRMLP
ncbi:uncharacterized protein LOC121405357 [Drosophila obscura]|uniref:uncharacterized protein LOC121405357 n=1 Tax=Drosophila obscura TaxID=7282 RepID=UPI001BB2B408|nr:uncharacterized protein LOC121405357 [Drosophila obscura]